MRWDPQRYAMFGDYRDRPFFDLTGQVTAAAPRTVVDLGCGPGHLTVALANRWPQAQVIGIDASPEMIDRARAAHDGANVRFECADVQSFNAAGTDVVVSNALLQWLPGHRGLLATWLDQLAPGAWLAFQVPGNFDSPSHALMRSLASSPRWRGQLGSVLRHEDAVDQPGTYLRLMLDAGYHAEAWETTYVQLLTGANPVLDWVRGTGLRPVLDILGRDDVYEFEAEYGAALQKAYPPGQHGTVFPFRRIFCVGQKNQ